MVRGSGSWFKSTRRDWRGNSIIGNYWARIAWASSLATSLTNSISLMRCASAVNAAISVRSMYLVENLPRSGHQLPQALRHALVVSVEADRAYRQLVEAIALLFPQLRRGHQDLIHRRS